MELITPVYARVSAHIHGASFGDTSSRSLGLSVSPCRIPGCLRIPVDMGVKRTSLAASSSAHPCWLVPCRSDKLDRALKSQQIMVASPRSSSIPSRKSKLIPVMHVVGCMYALMSIRNLCLSSDISIHIPNLVYHLSKLSGDNVLLRSF